MINVKISFEKILGTCYESSKVALSNTELCAVLDVQVVLSKCAPGMAIAPPGAPMCPRPCWVPCEWLQGAGLAQKY